MPKCTGSVPEVNRKWHENGPDRSELEVIGALAILYIINELECEGSTSHF